MKDTKLEPLRYIVAPVGMSHFVIDTMDLIGYNWYASELDDENRAKATAQWVNKCIEAARSKDADNLEKLHSLCVQVAGNMLHNLGDCLCRQCCSIKKARSILGVPEWKCYTPTPTEP